MWLASIHMGKFFSEALNTMIIDLFCINTTLLIKH